MAKPKSPLLSLGARGTIADTLTFQKRGQDTIARQKPIPKDPYSLAQAYQRWDYRDYAYLWTLESEASKQSYRTRASRYHITGYSLWMREHLKDLPDLAARWRMDEKGGAVVYDTSKNANNGTIFGATPTTGPINGAFYFDGLNDYLKFTTPPIVPPADNLTLDFFFNLLNTGSPQYLFTDNTSGRGRIELYLLPSRKIYFATSKAGAPKYTSSINQAFEWGQTYHFAVTLDFPTATFYLDAIDITLSHGTHIPPDPATLPLFIGRTSNGLYHLKGTLDNFVYYNRAEDITEIQRHSERRYPS